MSNPYQQPQDPYGQNPYGGSQPGFGQPTPPQPMPAQPAYGYPQQAPPQAYPPPAQPAPPYAAPPGYPQDYGYPQAPAPGYYTGEPNQLAMAAVGIGFVSVLGLCMDGIGGFLGLLGVGLGIAALNKSKITGTGRNQAIGGIVLSSLGILTGIALVVAFAVAAKS